MRITETYLSLLEGAQSGDPASLERLLQKCQPDVRHYAQRQCRITDIDDAVQEVLLIVARRLESLRVLAAFSSWLFRTVQRECRRLGRKTLGFDPFDEAQLERWLARFSDYELTVELARALEKLPAHHREVILLRDVYGWTLREIAGESGITIAAAKSRLHRARDAVRQQLMS